MKWNKKKALIVAGILVGVNWIILWLTARGFTAPLEPNQWGVGGAAFGVIGLPILIVLIFGLPLRALRKRTGRPLPDLWQFFGWLLLGWGVLATLINIARMGRFH